MPIVHIEQGATGAAAASDGRTRWLNADALGANGGQGTAGPGATPYSYAGGGTLLDGGGRAPDGGATLLDGGRQGTTASSKARTTWLDADAAVGPASDDGDNVD